MSLAPGRAPRPDLAFCFPCQPLNSFSWDASVAAGCPEAETMFALASTRLADTSLAPPTHLQVITFTSAAAYAAALMERGVVPAFCLPHSMGLYAALVAAGACDFEPMLDYVIAAGQAIHAFGQTGDFEMASLFGIETPVLEEVCGGVDGVHIANHNSTGHAVVSGQRWAVEEACRIAVEKHSSEARLLNTGVPLHAPLMASVSRTLAAKLAGFTIRTPQVSVLCPFRAVPLEARDIIPVLSRHISEPVRFEDMVHAVARAGVTLILEVGYEKLLSKFVGWTNQDIAARSVGSTDALDREIRRLGCSARGDTPSAGAAPRTSDR